MVTSSILADGISCAQHQCHAVIGHRKSLGLMIIILTLPSPDLPMQVSLGVNREEADEAIRPSGRLVNRSQRRAASQQQGTS